jgi:hypothetical protein
MGLFSFNLYHLLKGTSMAAKTTFFKNRVLDFGLNNSAQFSWVPPTVVYVGLFTANPGDAGVLTGEVAGGSYLRQAVSWSTISNGVASNSALITFPHATADWGNVTYLGLLDAPTGGNMLMYAPATLAKTIGAGDDASLPIGLLTTSDS